MNNHPNQNIDPRKLAANAKVVIQPAPQPAKKVTIAPGRLQGLGTLPKPTVNPALLPSQQMGQLPDTSKTIANDSKQQPKVEPEVIKSAEIVSLGENKAEKADDRDEKGRFTVGNVPTGHRPKKINTSDYWLDIEMDKPHGKLPDGSVITKRQMLAKILADKALDGNLKAVEILYNRTDGKPMQKIQVIAPEDAEGTVLANEAQDKLLETFGRKPKHGTDNSKTNQGA